MTYQHLTYTFAVAKDGIPNMIPLDATVLPSPAATGSDSSGGSTEPRQRSPPSTG